MEGANIPHELFLMMLDSFTVRELGRVLTVCRSWYNYAQPLRIAKLKQQWRAINPGYKNSKNPEWTNIKLTPADAKKIIYQSFFKNKNDLTGKDNHFAFGLYVSSKSQQDLHKLIHVTSKETLFISPKKFWAKRPWHQEVRKALSLGCLPQVYTFFCFTLFNKS